MTDSAPAPVDPAYNDANIEKALIDAHGDLNIASQLMGHVTVAKLHRSIRVSDRLQAVFLAIEQAKTLPEFDRISTEQLEQEIARRLVLYRSDGLEAIHELAVMPIGDNSAMAQVKLAAASRLAGPTNDQGKSTEIEETLRELNERFHTEAPRIRLTRERTTLEVMPRENMIESSPD